MFDYPHLEVLFAIEREGSFERAAKSHGVSKPAISQTLKLLDLRMGDVTVCRSSARPTLFGNKLCRHFEHVKLMEQRFFSDNGKLFKIPVQPSGTVKVALNDDSISSWFTDVVTTTQCVQSKFFLDLIKAGQEKSKKMMVDSKISAAISRSNTPISGFACYFLGQHIYRAVASPEFVTRYFSNGVTLEALMKAPSVRLDAVDKLRRQWFANVLGETLDLPATNIHSAHGIAKVCVEGSAWGMNATLLIDAQIKSGQLVELIEGQTLVQNLYWHVRRSTVDGLLPLTDAVRNSARNQLYQPPIDE